MKSLILALAAAASVATPAYAAPYVEGNAQVQTKDIQRLNQNDLAYGLKVGYSAPVNSVANLTFDVGAENFLNGWNDTTLVAETGITGKLAGATHLYGQVGYLNTGGMDGYRLEGGLLQGLTKHSYAKIGYKRDTYHGDHADAVTAGLGVRF